MLSYLIAIVLVLLSATFSGLTLGYFSLNTQTLRRKAKLGNVHAQKILPIREQGNLLLTTLLLGNVLVNTILSVYLSTLASGVIAATIATALIFLFGEIIPQAAFSRHAMVVGAKAAPFTQMIILLLSPIAWPIAYIVNRLLGHEMPSMYSKIEIMELISEHEDSEHSTIDHDEERIVHGALKFSHTTVREVMTPRDQVYSFDINERLDESLIQEIVEHNYSRYPIYSGNRDNIVGILFTKDLLDEKNNTALKDTKEAFDPSYLTVRPDERLDSVLGKMLKKRQHMGIVKTKNGLYTGVVTLEDIIEEIIQVEIEDESDADDIE